jgi:hypothetical protein
MRKMKLFPNNSVIYYVNQQNRTRVYHRFFSIDFSVLLIYNVKIF